MPGAGEQTQPLVAAGAQDYARGAHSRFRCSRADYLKFPQGNQRGSPTRGVPGSDSFAQTASVSAYSTGPGPAEAGDSDRRLDVMFDEDGVVWLAGIHGREDMSRLQVQLEETGIQIGISKRNFQAKESSILGYSVWCPPQTAQFGTVQVHVSISRGRGPGIVQRRRARAARALFQLWRPFIRIRARESRRHPARQYASAHRHTTVRGTI